MKDTETANETANHTVDTVDVILSGHDPFSFLLFNYLNTNNNDSDFISSILNYVDTCTHQS